MDFHGKNLHFFVRSPFSVANLCQNTANLMLQFIRNKNSRNGLSRSGC